MGISPFLGLSSPTTLSMPTQTRARQDEQLIAPFRAALAEALRSLWERLGPFLTNRLAKSLGDELDDALDAFDWTAWGQSLLSMSVLVPLLTAHLDGQDDAATKLGIGFGHRDQAALRFARARAAQMIGMHVLPDGQLVPNPHPKWSITDATRDAVHDAVVDLLEHGTSRRELQEAVEASGAFPGLFGEYRADLIARSELAMAANAGATSAYKAQGIGHVHVLDNPACKICGPVANTTQTLAWAEANPIGHPNCIRAFNPLEPGTVEKVAPGEALERLALGTALIHHPAWVTH